MRSTAEWVAKHDDAAIPPRVRLRVFERYHGACQGCLRKLFPGDKWDCDHTVALVNGGEHRESNLRPMCQNCHRKKSAADVAEKAIAYRKRAKHVGIRKPSRFPCSRDSRWKKRLDGTVVERGR